MKRRNQHIDFDFKEQSGSGIEKLIPHVSNAGVDLITKLLLYNPEDRVSARQALRWVRETYVHLRSCVRSFGKNEKGESIDGDIMSGALPSSFFLLFNSVRPYFQY